MKKRPGVLLIATMDTKMDEAVYIEKCLKKEGVSVIIMDPGIRGRPSYKIGVSRGTIARAAGKTLKEVRAVGNEAKALNMMIPGASDLCRHYIVVFSELQQFPSDNTCQTGPTNNGQYYRNSEIHFDRRP